MSSRRGADIGQGQCAKATSNSGRVKKKFRIKETVNRTGHEGNCEFQAFESRS